MLACGRCERSNDDDARFCHGLWGPLGTQSAATRAQADLGLCSSTSLGSTARRPGRPGGRFAIDWPSLLRHVPHPDRPVRGNGREVHRRRGRGRLRGAARARRRRESEPSGAGWRPWRPSPPARRRATGARSWRIRGAVCTGGGRVARDRARTRRSARDRRRLEHRGASAERGRARHDRVVGEETYRATRRSIRYTPIDAIARAGRPNRCPRGSRSAKEARSAAASGRSSAGTVSSTSPRACGPAP